MTVFPGAEVHRDINLGDQRRSIFALLKRKTDIDNCLEEASSAVDVAIELSSVNAAWVWAKITGKDNNCITLSVEGYSGSFHLGDAYPYVAKAHLAMLSVITLGEKLDKKITEANDQGDTLFSYLLDQVGIIFLCRTCGFIRRKAIEEAKRMGWGIGPSIGPGSAPGWDLMDQKRFSSILPLESIGASVNDSGFLVPLKSVSAMVGIGPEYEYEGYSSVCSLCSSRVNNDFFQENRSLE